MNWAPTLSIFAVVIDENDFGQFRSGDKFSSMTEPGIYRAHGRTTVPHTVGLTGGCRQAQLIRYYSGSRGLSLSKPTSAFDRLRPRLNRYTQPFNAPRMIPSIK